MNVGKQSTIDIYDCKADIDNLDLIKSILVESAKEANLHVVDVIFHKFEPIGISGVVILAESHITIHTWPEYKFVACDAFTCGTNMNPRSVLEIISEKLGSNKYNIKDFSRGDL